MSRSSKAGSGTGVRFGQAANGALNSSDAEFLAAVRWRGGSSSSIGQQAATTADLKTIGMCWKQQLIERKYPAVVHARRGFATLDRAVHDALDGDFFHLLGQVRDLSRRSKKTKRQKLSESTDGAIEQQSPSVSEKLETWLSQAGTEIERDPFVLLGCCELLILHGRRLPAALLGGVWRATLAGALSQLLRAEDDASEADWKNLSGERDVEIGLWLRSGLLAWTCGLLFDEVKGAPRLARAGRAALNEQLLNATCEAGVPFGSALESFSLVNALWSDALRLSILFERPLWHSDADVRYRRMLTAIAALVRHDGVISGELHCSEKAAASLLACVDLVGEDNRIGRWKKIIAQVADAAQHREPGKSSANTVRGKKREKVGRRKSAMKVHKKEIPSWQSDDSEVACLRSRWAPDASLISVLYHRHPMQMEMEVDGTPLLSGLWDVELRDQDRVLSFDNGWDCVCWYADEDVDYCELRFSFDDGPKLDRHLLLSRTRQFAIVSDVLSEAPQHRFDLVSRLPLQTGVSGTHVDQSRELRLRADNRLVRVYPLFLPQDTGIGTSGEATFEEFNGRSVLKLAQSTVNGGLFAPVVFDWSQSGVQADNEKSLPDAEWRPLTVTDFGRKVTREAGAYRVSAGDLHMLLYRALLKTSHYRTVLGYQTTHETVVADFTKKGVLSEVLLVE